MVSSLSWRAASVNCTTQTMVLRSTARPSLTLRAETPLYLQAAIFALPVTGASFQRSSRYLFLAAVPINSPPDPWELEKSNAVKILGSFFELLLLPRLVARLFRSGKVLWVNDARLYAMMLLGQLRGHASCRRLALLFTWNVHNSTGCWALYLFPRVLVTFNRIPMRKRVSERHSGGLTDSYPRST